MFYLLPAAVVLVVSAFTAESTGTRVLFATFGFGFLVMGLKTALTALDESAAILRRMRFGFVTLGRIVSCRPALDRKGAEIPYRDFLENWTTIVSNFQFNQLSGCLSSLLSCLTFVTTSVPLAVAGLLLTVVYFALPAGWVGADGLDRPYIAKFIVGGLVIGYLISLFRRHIRLMFGGKFVLELPSRAQPGKDDVYDTNAMSLATYAKEGGAKISLKYPLPAYDNNPLLEVICNVEYSVMGKPCSATARVPLSNRLKLTSVEQLLFIPAEPGEIDLVAGLPSEVRIDAQGQWSDVPDFSAGVQLSVTGAVALVALAALCWHVLAFFEM